MTAEDIRRIEELFHRASNQPRDCWEDLLRESCPDDPGLRQKVLAMLEQADQDRSFAPPGWSAEGPEESLGPGSVIDRYKLLQVIGEGGFGTVYMAEQQEPVVRKVALKIIKLGMDTKEVVARFEAERQALALMDHPSIARVLDGGATSTGRPYFVMELVRGVSITEYCDQNRLTTRERLILFQDVCAAVQHAHQKGVIHRDLKPSNVLVTLHDGTPVPKVIDFGIAKAINTRLTERTLFTRFQQFVGTPAYMSPEQAEMSGLDVDTRSDLYSLGVLLYELLTGSTPFDTQALWQAGFSEMQRVIREVPPERPSLRISTSGSVELAQRRGIDVSGLSRRLRGDLDWILMKALAKERGRRYGTASEFAEDIRRHLEHVPVDASPPSPLYRLKKFVSRNRAAVISSALIGVAVLVGIVGVTVGYWEASAQRDRARAEAANVRVVTDFLVETISLADPHVVLNADMSVGHLLDETAAKIEGAFPHQPESEVRLRSTMGHAYRSLSEPELADRQFRQAVALIDEIGDYDPLQFYQLLWAQTNVAFTLEQDDCFAWANRARRVGHDAIRAGHPDLAEVLDEFHFAIEHGAHGVDPAPIQKAVGFFEDSLRIAEASLPRGDPLWTIVAETYLACAYWLWYSPHEPVTVAFCSACVEIRERELPAGHPDIAEAVALLVGVLGRTGRASEVEERIRSSVQQLRRAQPRGTFHLAFVESMLGDCLTKQGNYAEAEAYLLESHEVIVKTTPPTAFYATDSLKRIVAMYDAWGKPELAESHRIRFARSMASARFLQPWPMARPALGPEQRELGDTLDQLHQVLGVFSYSLCDVRSPDGDFLEPLQRLQRILSERSKVPEDPYGLLIGRTLWNWVKTIPLDQHLAEIQIMLETGLQWIDRDAPDLSVELCDALTRLGLVVQRQGDSERAALLLDEAVALEPAFVRPDHWINALLRINIGRSLFLAGRMADAESFLVPAFTVFERHMGATNPDSRLGRTWLRELYEATGETEKAQALRVSNP